MTDSKARSRATDNSRITNDYPRQNTPKRHSGPLQLTEDRSHPTLPHRAQSSPNRPAPPARPPPTPLVPRRRLSSNMSEDMHASTSSLPARRGPLSAPASPLWRRRRLLNLGTPSAGPSPEATFTPNDPPHSATGAGFPSYGTMPRGSADRLAQSFPGPEAPLLGLNLRSSRPKSFFDTFGRRQPTAYDGHGTIDTVREGEEDEGARINGIRVWYSSFTSIDWLHDAVCILFMTHPTGQLTASFSLAFCRLKIRPARYAFVVVDQLAADCLTR